MPRLLALIIALMLPVQFAWSAASAYCQHETSPQSAHFGHHFHTHRGESKSPAASQLAPDADCAACHAADASAVAPEIGPTHIVAPSSSAIAPSPLPLTSALVRAPDRPQWPRLV